MASPPKPAGPKPAAAKPRAKPAASKPAPKAPAAISQKAAAATSGMVSAQTPVLEWIAAGVGLVLVLATIGLLAFDALGAAASPPSVAVRALQVHRTADGYVVEVRARNSGGSPAAGVRVEGELATAGAAPEIAEATFDFLPARSDRDGGLFFSRDPRAGTLTLRATGYVDP